MSIVLTTLYTRVLSLRTSDFWIRQRPIAHSYEQVARPSCGNTLLS